MNYLFLKSGWLFLKYAYVDLIGENGYVADSLFYRHKVPVRFGGVMVKKGEKYRIVLCKIRKKYRKEFEKALAEISNKMYLLGYTDYDAFCATLLQKTEKTDAA